MTGRVILKGFICDGASIPRAFWRIAGHPLQGDILPAAIEHDADYAAQIIGRDEADERFRYNMAQLGVGVVRRNVFYWAVRLFGGIAWRNNAPDVEHARRFVLEEAEWKSQKEKRSTKRNRKSKRNGGSSARK